MSQRSLVMLGLFIGSSIGSYVPLLFGASIISFSSILCGSLGGIMGVYVAYKLS